MTTEDIPEAEQEEYRFSTLFQRLVTGSDDLVGMVAYGIYKQEKRDWIIRFRQQHQKRPTDSEVEAFNDHYSDAALQRFRSEAESMMLDFAEVIVDSRAPEIKKRARVEGFEKVETAITAAAADVKQHVDKQTNPAWSVFWNVVAWVFTLAITIAAAGALLLPNIVDRLAERLVTKEVPAATQPAKP